MIKVGQVYEYKKNPQRREVVINIKNGWVTYRILVNNDIRGDFECPLYAYTTCNENLNSWRLVNNEEEEML
jgi:hypothetical protein